jgi:hypothetical protein
MKIIDKPDTFRIFFTSSKSLGEKNVIFTFFKYQARHSFCLFSFSHCFFGSFFKYSLSSSCILRFSETKNKDKKLNEDW